MDFLEGEFDVYCLSYRASSSIAAAVAAALFGSSVAHAQAQNSAQNAAKDEVVQDVIITGTFIRRSEGFTPASPVSELSRDDFEAHAPKTVADFLTELPYSFNTPVRRRPSCWCG